MTSAQLNRALASLNATTSLAEAKRIAAKAITLRDREPNPEIRSRLNALQARAQLRIAQLCTIEEWIVEYEAHA